MKQAILSALTVSALLIAGCSGATPDDTENQGGASSAAGAPSAAVPPGGAPDSGTKFVSLDPWAEGTIDSIDSVIDGSIPGDDAYSHLCTASNTSNRADAFRCFAFHIVYDPCFQDPKDPSAFACLVPVNGVHWQVLKSMPLDGTVNPSPIATGNPILIETFDGTTCSGASGAGPKGVPGFPYWAGTCLGTHAGVWRTNDESVYADNPNHRNIFGPTEENLWQVAVSNDGSTSEVQLLDIKNVYH